MDATSSGMERPSSIDNIAWPGQHLQLTSSASTRITGLHGHVKTLTLLTINLKVTRGAREVAAPVNYPSVSYYSYPLVLKYDNANVW